MTAYQRICLAAHSRVAGASTLAAEIAARHADAADWWVTDEHGLLDAASSERLAAIDLLLTVGGDGMILRGLHAATEHDVPVLGVNMGRVGFMSEVDAADAPDAIGWYLQGNGHIDERTMIKASIASGGADPGAGAGADAVADADAGAGADAGAIAGAEPMWAVNDVTVFRGAEPRVIEVAAVVDDFSLLTYRGDGVVVSTATGSTGYTLQLGGPVIDPASSVLLMKPLASHMSQSGGIVLDHSSMLELRLLSDTSAQFLVDGMLRTSMRHDDTVRIERGTRHAKFLRRAPRNAFWGDLSQRLGMRVGAAERGE